MTIVKEKKEHLNEIDIALGITMCLVVFGHMYFISTAGVSWYEKVRLFIYQFHMAVFYFIMGFLFSYTKDINSKNHNHWEYCYRKAIKFGRPFLFFAVIYFFIDFALAVDKTVYLNKFWSIILDQFLYPTRAPATFLWFIYVLFLYYLTIPLLVKLFPRKGYLVLLVVGIALVFIKLPSIFALEMFGKYFIFFILGMFYSFYKNKSDQLIRRFGWIFIFFWAALFIAFLLIEWENSFAASIASIISVLYVSERLAKTSNIFNVIGKNVFPIYLQNTTIIGLLYAFLIRVLEINSFKIQYFIPLFFFLAIFIPLKINKLIPQKFSLLRLTLGYI
jgi:hypothetical protein